MNDYKDFIEYAKCFGDTHKKFYRKTPMCDLKTTEERIKHIFDKRLVEWNNYKVDKINKLICNNCNKN